MQVPACAPQTREEWAAQNAIWPITWRQPETTAFRASMQAPAIDDSTFRLMCAHMDQAVAQAQHQGACNGAIIVDPQQGEARGAKPWSSPEGVCTACAYAVNALHWQPPPPACGIAA